jgi:hypothetical protein
MYYKLNQMTEMEASDSCAFEGQLDAQDDSACPSSSPSGNVEDSTLRHSGHTCEDLYVLALRHDEIRRLDDLPMGVDMASRKSYMEDDELPIMSEPHFSSSQSPMLATTHEDISGIPDMVDEPCLGNVHKGHMDLQAREERYGLEIVDLTHTYQYEESESPLLEIPLMDQVVETDSLLEHLLPGSIYSDEDALLIGRNDHSTCLTHLYGIQAQMILVGCVHRRIQLPIQDTMRLRWGSQLVMACSGIQEDSVAQWTVSSLVPYLLRSMLLRIPLLTLAVRGMKLHLNKVVI